tara:strand:+ start:1541 stop:1819 length:279 start_codon:yes stop_codon:yes gene_type:complete
MLEGEYLELVDQLQKKYNDNEIKFGSLKLENKMLKKEVITAYCVIRLIDNLSQNEFEISDELKSMIEILRGHLSTTYDDVISIRIPPLPQGL